MVAVLPRSTSSIDPSPTADVLYDLPLIFLQIGVLLQHTNFKKVTAKPIGTKHTPTLRHDLSPEWWSSGSQIHQINLSETCLLR